MDLRDLDDRVVPRAAAWVRGVHEAVDAGPGPAALLRGLDDRYASSGPLRIVRDVPLLGVLAVMAVLLAGVGTSVALGPSAAQDGRAQAPAEVPVLGAPAGVDAQAHLAAAHDRVVELARQAPGTRALALVSLQDELTVAQTVRLLVESQLVLRRAYVRAPVAGQPEVFAVDLAEDPERTLTAFWRATAARKAEDQRELRALATAAGTPPHARASHEAAAATAGLESAAYAAGCACVLAVVVEGPASELAELTALPAVRGVEVAPPGSRLAEVQVVPLPPEVSGVVPAAPAGGS